MDCELWTVLSKNRNEAWDVYLESVQYGLDYVLGMWKCLWISTVCLYRKEKAFISRTLWNFRGSRTSDIQVVITNSMEHTQRVSWKTSYSISRNQCSRKKLPWTSTRSYQWRRRIWSRINQRSQKTRQRLSVFGSMEGILRRNMGNRKQPRECLWGSSEL